jgi:hypothetical protein
MYCFHQMLIFHYGDGKNNIGSSVIEFYIEYYARNGPGDRVKRSSKTRETVQRNAGWSNA